MNRTVATCAAALVAALFWGTSSVETFYDDTHFSFTYYMARECGYTPLQALRLASADVSIDYATPTEPVQGIKTAFSAASYASLSLLSVFAGPAFSSAAQQPRVDFHAMRDARNFGRGQQTEAEAAIKAREGVLQRTAIATRNPGILLHFIQDEPSHQGYGSVGGHWLSAVTAAEAKLQGRPAGPVRGRPVTVANPNAPSLAALDTLADPTLPLGATTDFLSYRPERRNMMVAQTVEALSQFMATMSPRQHQRPQSCNGRAIQSIAEALARANKVTDTRQQYKDQIAGLMQKIIAGAATLTFDDTKKLLDALQRELGTNETIPDVRRANDVVEKALLAEGELEQYPKDRLTFDYDRNGDLVGLLSQDTFTTYGTVVARVTREGPLQDAVAVSVWAAPTRSKDQPYQFECRTVAGLDAQGGAILPDRFERLPVGDLIVRAVSESGTIVQQPVTLTKVEQDVVINIPEEQDKIKQCGQKAFQAAKQMCTNSSGFSPANVSSATASSDVESRFQSLLDEAQTCRQRLTQNQPQQNQPQKKPGGGAGKAVAVVAVGAAGGLGAAALAKRLLTTSTSSSTTTTSVRPITTTTAFSSTTVASTTTVSGSLRCSTKSCVVNLVGSAGSCDCNDRTSASVNVVCPIQNANVIQRTVNGSCMDGVFAYCDVNLSCNNRRCERDFSQGGRCRFTQ